MSKSSTFAQLLPGMQLYKYELRYRIGSGGFGEVWLALDHAIGCEYAIKVLKPGTPINERLREAQIGHVLDHANVVRVHQADVTRVGSEDFVIIAMDYIEKGPLTKLANPSLFLMLPDVIKFGIDILRGLEYLHSNDFLHNDIKPENILVGSYDQGMLTDYGIVGVSKGGAPVQVSSFYKIHVAPEVLKTNEMSAQTDIYQAGLTLFRLLVGLDTLRQKFVSMGEARYYEAVRQSNLISSGEFPPYVPNKLRRIIRQAIEPDLSKRFKSALSFRRKLEQLNYPGYWTVESSGSFTGFNGHNAYRFTQSKTSKNRFTVQAYKRNLNSGHEVRCLKYCGKNLTDSDSKKIINNFVRAVVEGI